MVDDNFNYMNEEYRYEAGKYEKYEDAVAKCKSIVDEFLYSALKLGMTAEELYSNYKMFGDDPFINGKAKQKYSSWDYAKNRCKALTKC